MKLSDIKTADQLILALADEGYRKEPAGVGVSANGNYIPPKPGPFYSYGFWASELPVPELSIYPQRRYQVEFDLFDHGTDLWLPAGVIRASSTEPVVPGAPALPSPPIL